MKHDFEFYETPHTFTHYLFDQVDVRGRIFEPCVGSGAIIEARYPPNRISWFTNDLDPRWPADVHKDATDRTLWEAHEFDWTITNPPFESAVKILTLAYEFSKVGVAMHLRASIHEVLKARVGGKRTGPREPFWLRDHPPTAILWLPRFGYQRSKTTGKWTTDSVGACWCIWDKTRRADQGQFIRYAPEWVIDELDAETPHYRARMDKLMAERKIA